MVADVSNYARSASFGTSGGVEESYKKKWDTKQRKTRHGRGKFHEVEAHISKDGEEWGVKAEWLGWGSIGCRLGI